MVAQFSSWQGAQNTFSERHPLTLPAVYFPRKLLLTVGCCLVCLSTFSRSAIQSPLKEVPNAETIVALGNWPWRIPFHVARGNISGVDGGKKQWNSRPVQRVQLSEGDLLNFLRHGQLHTNSADIAKYSGSSIGDIALCMGVFFTSKNEAYYWKLVTEQTLFLWNSSSQLAAISVGQACRPIVTYSTNKFLVPPKKEENIALVLTNNIWRDRSPSETI
jgi:hypothetical protein